MTGRPFVRSTGAHTSSERQSSIPPPLVVTVICGHFCPSFVPSRVPSQRRDRRRRIRNAKPAFYAVAVVDAAHSVEVTRSWERRMHGSADRRNVMNALSKTLIIIAIIGALNWGLIGFFNFNLVDAIFGGGSAEETSAISRVIYAIVGLAGLAGLAMLPRLHEEERTHERLAHGRA